MKFSDQIKSGGFTDTSTMQGAAVLAVVFAFFAWLFGRALRLAVQRVLGTVENLTLGYTLLRTDDNRRVVVPNSLMASQTAINLTTNDPRVVCSVPVTIGYDADIDKAHCRFPLRLPSLPRRERWTSKFPGATRTIRVHALLL